MSELKPCPFCGGEAEIVVLDRWWGDDLRDFYKVACKNKKCNVIVETIIEYEKKDAIEAWNRRVNE